MDQELLQQIKDLYPISDPQFDTHDREQGHSAHNFTIHNEGVRYFVKTYNSALSEKDLRAIHAAKFLYSESGIPVILPLRNREGNSFFKYGKRFYAVFPYIDKKIAGAIPSERAVASMGNMLARMHHAGLNKGSIVKHRKIFSWTDKKFEHEVQTLLQKIQALPEKTTFDEEAEKFITYKAALAKEYPIRFKDLKLENSYLIHGDFSLKNVFFNDDDSIAYVFDFERVMQGPRATEIIFSLFFICFTFDTPLSDADREKQFQLAKIFLTSYIEEYPITWEEHDKGFVWYVMGDLMRTFWIEARYYIAHNYQVASLLPERSARLHYFAENFEMISNRLREYVELANTNFTP